MHLVNLETFVCMAELGSLAAAARGLGIPKSTVARRVESLEEELGVALVQRTGRKLALTDDGRALCERCSLSLREIRAVKENLVDRTAHPTGKLAVGMPLEGGASEGLLALVVGPFVTAFPGVQVELREMRIDQTALHLLADGSDVVFQLTAVGDGYTLPDVDYVIARPLGKVPMGIFASASYVRAHGEPRTLADVASHRCLTATDGPLNDHWTLFDGSGREERVPVTPVMTSNHPTALLALGVAGVGITILPAHVSHDFVRQGVMQRVLGDWAPAPLTINLVWLRSRHLAPRVRAFVDHVQSRIVDVPWIE